MRDRETQKEKSDLNPKRKVARLAAACLLTLLISVGTYSSYDDSGKGDTCGVEVSGLRSCIWLDSQVFGNKQKVLVHYKIQNVSDGEIVLWQSGFWHNNTIVVLNDHGQSIKQTKEGAETWLRSRLEANETKISGCR